MHSFNKWLCSVLGWSLLWGKAEIFVGTVVEKQLSCFVLWTRVCSVGFTFIKGNKPQNVTIGYCRINVQALFSSDHDSYCSVIFHSNCVPLRSQLYAHVRDWSLLWVLCHWESFSTWFRAAASTAKCDAPPQIFSTNCKLCRPNLIFSTICYVLYVCLMLEKVLFFLVKHYFYPTVCFGRCVKTFCTCNTVRDMWDPPARPGCRRWWKRYSRWEQCCQWVAMTTTMSAPPASGLELCWSLCKIEAKEMHININITHTQFMMLKHERYQIQDSFSV